MEKLSAHSAIFWAIIDFDLDDTGGLLLLRGQGVPPLLETIDNEVTRFIGTAKIQV